MPVANAMDVTMKPKGKHTDALNSTENAGNKCPEGQNCWVEYQGKWKTQLINENVNNKVGGQNAIYNGIDGTCGVYFCFGNNVKCFFYFICRFGMALNTMNSRAPNMIRSTLRAWRNS
jgi:hypothetical protein